MTDRIKLIATDILAQAWGRLTSYTIDYRRQDGQVQRLKREVYDHGNAAAIVLFDPARQTVLLVRQFRYPPTLNGDNGDILEVCAGLLDGDDPQTCAIREAIEETGHEPHAVRHLFDIYPSPGSLSEKTSLFVGHYNATTQRNAGGGLADEGEEIEVVELPLTEAMSMVGDGRIADAKTIILLQHLSLSA